MNDGESIGLNCGKYFITVSHKAITHFLRNLINSNSGVKASTETPNQSFINGEDNFMIDNFDESENFEVLFFGLSNLTLTIGGNHFLFNINN